MMSKRELKIWCVVSALFLVGAIMSFLTTAHGAEAASQPACSTQANAILTWLAANWQMVLLAYLIPCLLAGWRNHEPGSGVVGFLMAAVQWIAVTVPKDSPGTLKLPFTKPVAPKSGKRS